jgi:hypothetical protein
LRKNYLCNVLYRTYCFPALSVAIFLVIGCVTVRWVQEGKTADDIAAALVACEQAMLPQPTPLADPVSTEPDQSVIVKCMKDKGYKLVGE